MTCELQLNKSFITKIIYTKNSKTKQNKSGATKLKTRKKPHNSLSHLCFSVDICFILVSTNQLFQLLHEHSKQTLNPTVQNLCVVIETKQMVIYTFSLLSGHTTRLHFPASFAVPQGHVMSYNQWTVGRSDAYYFQA